MRAGLLVVLAIATNASADQSIPMPPKPGGPLPVVAERLELPGKIYYETAKAVIKPVSFPVLDRVVETLLARTELRIEVQVHTDERGDDGYNLKLSGDRANAVKQYLVDHRVPGDRMQARGYGETKPVCTEHNEPCWSRNRRTDFVVQK